MPMHTDVKFLHSQMEGAPQIDNTPGSLNKTLEIVLIHGFGEKTLTSLAVTGNVATATLAGHGFERYTVVKIAGAAEAQLNGVHRITDVDTDWFKFETVGVSDTTETGIKVSYAPLGQWSMPFHSDTKQEAIFKSTHPKASRAYYYINDADTSNKSSGTALVEMREDVTSLEKYGRGVTHSQYKRIGRFYSTNKTKWMICGDSLGFFIGIDTSNTNCYGFSYIGDIISAQANDEYYGVLHLTNQNGYFYGSDTTSGNTNFGHGNTNFLILRNYRLLPQAVGLNMDFQQYWSGKSSRIAFPNPSNNALYLIGPQPLTEDTNLRGFMPGYYACPQNCYSYFSNGVYSYLENIEGVGQDKLILRINAGYSSNESVIFLNATKWRD